MDGVAVPSHIALSDYSDLQVQRLAYVPPSPASAANPELLVTQPGETTVARSAQDAAALRAWFPKTYPQPIVNIARAGANDAVGDRAPLRVGVVFCGRQCPGANNVVTGARAGGGGSGRDGARSKEH